MANNYVLNIQDTASVNAWKEKVERLNERTEIAVQNAGKSLEDFTSVAEGNVIEELKNLGGQLITATATVAKGMLNLVAAVMDMSNLVKTKGSDLARDTATYIGQTFNV